MRCKSSGRAAPTCTDIDECATDGGGCGDPTKMTCVNNYAAENSCEDIDECADPALNDCTADNPCINIKGGHYCGCSYPNIYDPAMQGCRPAHVLVLEDLAGSSLASALRAEGFVATDGGVYNEATSLALTGIDTIFWQQGWRYHNLLQPGVEDAIADFVESGGGLVRTEWGMWHEAAMKYFNRPADHPRLLAMMPVTPGITYKNGHFGMTWNVTNPTSSLTFRLPSTINATGGYTIVGMRPMSEMVASSLDSRVVDSVTVERVVPTITYTSAFGGVIMHINDTLMYPNNVRTAIEPDMMQVYFNALLLSAQRLGR